MARQSYEKLPTILDRLGGDGRPDFEQYVEGVRKELAARLAEPEPEAAQP